MVRREGSASSKDIASLLDRDAGRLAEELRKYPDEADLWKVVPGIRNSAGTLALHVIGNLNHFVGATLGDSGYVRDREREFAARDIPRSELLAELDAVRVMVRRVVPGLVPERMAQTFPGAAGPFEGVTTGFFLLHLATHLSYHLGQINYHRRLLVEGEETLGAP
jgi:hypothetical protein